MDSGNIKAGMGITTVMLASLAVIGLQPVTPALIISHTTTLVFLLWLLGKRRPVAAFALPSANYSTQHDSIAGISTANDQHSAATSSQLEEVNSLLESAITYVLRNAAKLTTLCKIEQKNLYHVLQTIKSLHLTLLNRCEINIHDGLIDERLNYLDYHADRMILLIDSILELIIKLENLANSAKTSLQGLQPDRESMLHQELNVLSQTLDIQLRELADFIKHYSHDRASQTLENSGDNLQIILHSIKSDIDAFLNILNVASCLHAGSSPRTFIH